MYTRNTNILYRHIYQTTPCAWHPCNTGIQWNSFRRCATTYYLLVNLKQQQKLLVNIMQHQHPVEIYFQRSATMRVGLRKLDAVACIGLMCLKVFLDLPWCSHWFHLYIHVPFQFCFAVEHNVRDVDCELV